MSVADRERAQTSLPFPKGESLPSGSDPKGWGEGDHLSAEATTAELKPLKQPEGVDPLAPAPGSSPGQAPLPPGEGFVRPRL